MLKKNLLENYQKFVDEFNWFELKNQQLKEVLPVKYKEAIKVNDVLLFKKLMSSKKFYLSTERAVAQIKKYNSKNEKK